METTGKLEAAGALIFARSTGRFLITLRPPAVVDPNVWCGVGGKIEDGETPEVAAKREIQEEIGYSGFSEFFPLYTYESDSLKFYNFIGIVEEEFTPVPNWEIADYKWCLLGDFPKPKHYGLIAIEDDLGAMRILTSLVADNHNLTVAALIKQKAVTASTMKLPFLSKLGVSTVEQQLPPREDTFPLAFNKSNTNLWKLAVKNTPATKSPSAAWAIAVHKYVELCVEHNVYPMSSMHQSTNDFIISDLHASRQAVVKFLNRSGMLRLVTMRTTHRSVKLTATGFVIQVHGSCILRDPTFEQWLTRIPSPGFNLIKDNTGRYCKDIAKNTTMVVSNEGASMASRWHVGYEIKVNHFPDIPGNEMPTKSQLEKFILEVLYMPVLLSHRPIGHLHRLI